MTRCCAVALTIAALLLGGCASSASPGPATAASTREVTYAPFAADGTIVPSLRVIATKAATNCVGEGVAGTSSYRCFSGSSVYDPCFARPGASTGPLVCPTDLVESEVIELTASSLPSSAGSPVGRAWAIRLADGQECELIDAAWSGLGPFGCQPTPPGPIADCHTPVQDATRWTVSCQDHETSSSPFTTFAVDTVWR